ncbi:uncharacterized protein METZ01_LOCUS303711, partial [marine metagenome]
VSKSQDYPIEKGEVLIGSGLLKEKGNTKIDRVNYMVEYMRENGVFKHMAGGSGSDFDVEQLNQLSALYREYRKKWKGQPKRCIRESLLGPT